MTTKDIFTLYTSDYKKGYFTVIIRLLPTYIGNCTNLSFCETIIIV